MIDDLYNTDILTLSSGLRNERLDTPDGSARKVSKLCGSWLEIDVKMQDHVVSDVALRVQACALGQSSAAILQQGIMGASLDEIIEARDALAYPARHASTMLAFDAAVDAVESALQN